MSTLCIIPARAGSKRIPGKNFRPFLGKPIIEYPLAVVKSFPHTNDAIVISTDSKRAYLQYYNYALLRSEKNSRDEATTSDVVDEVLKYTGIDFEYILVVYPCAVFITKELLETAYHDIKSDKSADCIYPCMGYSMQDAGQFYLMRMSSYFEQRKIFMDACNIIPMNAIDINTEEDWKRAEELFERTRKTVGR